MRFVAATYVVLGAGTGTVLGALTGNVLLRAPEIGMAPGFVLGAALGIAAFVAVQESEF